MTQVLLHLVYLRLVARDCAVNELAPIVLVFLVFLLIDDHGAAVVIANCNHRGVLTVREMAMIRRFDRFLVLQRRRFEA